MKFEYAGSQFQLEFERKFKIVSIRRRINKITDVTETQRSNFPYTTARLIGVHTPAAPVVIAQASVGCCPTDKFSNEEGRRQALRKLTKLVEGKQFRAKLWETYNKRSQPNG
jgi:hypothetical protein